MRQDPRAPTILLACCLIGCATSPERAANSGSAEPGSGRETMAAHAIHAPNPDQKALQQTNAARFHKSDGDVVIGFCVDTEGKTTDLEVLESFPGDPGIDAIVLETVATWRFDPFIVDGRPMKTCSTKTFKFHFKGPEPRGPSQTPTQPLEPLPPSLALDLCVHLSDMMLAEGMEASEAEIDLMLHGCVEQMEAQRQAVGDAVFERKAACILGSDSFEAMASCRDGAG